MASTDEPTYNSDLFGPHATMALAAPLLARAEAVIDLRWQAMILRRRPPGVAVGGIERPDWHIAAEAGRPPSSLRASVSHALLTGGVRGAIVVPLRHAGNSLGLWVLGPRVSPELIDPGQLAALKRLARGYAATLEVGVYRAWVASCKARALAATQGTSDPLLTSRERDVASLLALGQSNQQIGQHLGIAAGTVAKHIEHIMSKLNYQTRSQIAVWAADRGLGDAHLNG